MNFCDCMVLSVGDGSSLEDPIFLVRLVVHCTALHCTALHCTNMNLENYLIKDNFEFVNILSNSFKVLVRKFDKCFKILAYPI